MLSALQHGRPAEPEDRAAHLPQRAGDVLDEPRRQGHEPASAGAGRPGRAEAAGGPRDADGAGEVAGLVWKAFRARLAWVDATGLSRSRSQLNTATSRSTQRTCPVVAHGRIAPALGSLKHGAARGERLWGRH